MRGFLRYTLDQSKYPWLPRTWKRGKTVYEFTGYTYGCVRHEGIAVTERPKNAPFYEIPENAVIWESK